MKYNDYELLDLIYENDEVAYDILIKKYKPIIYNKSLEYFNYVKSNGYEGFSLDDFLGEGVISLNQAIKNYDCNKGVLFYSFFLVCLTSNYNIMFRKMFTKKNRPLLKYSELDYEVNDSNSVDPYNFIESLDISKKVNDYLISIGFLDAAILELRLNDFKYNEIECLLNVSSSKISRTIKKFKEYFNYY